MLDDPLEIFCACLWEPDDLVEVRLFMPRGETGRPLQQWCKASKLPRCHDELRQKNQNGYGVYAGVLPRNGRSGRDVDCLPGLVAWMDFDGEAPDVVLDMVLEVELPSPCLLIDSGHGTHCYWRFEDRVAPEDLRTLVSDLAVLVGSDGTVKNPSRVMRIPGFLNTKKPVRPVDIIEYAEGRRYTWDAIRGAVPAKKTQQQSPQQGVGGAIAASDVVQQARRWAAAVPGFGEGERNSKGFYVAARLLRGFSLSQDQARPILAAWNQSNSPPMEEPELDSILSDADKYGTEAEGGKIHAGTSPHPPSSIPNAVPSAEVPRRKEPVMSRDALVAEFEAEERGERLTPDAPWPTLTSMSNIYYPGSVAIFAGPQGNGKSMAVMQMIVDLQRNGHSVAYLPMEKDENFWGRRLLAHISGEWCVTETARCLAHRRREILDKHPEYDRLIGCIYPNPREPVEAQDGSVIVPPLPPSTVMQWITNTLKENRVVFLDPVSQIDFAESKEWQSQQAFMRELVAHAKASGGTVVLVTHTIKRPGKAGSYGLTAEDIQGSSMFAKLADSVVLLDAHNVVRSTIANDYNMPSEVEHGWTMIVAKARNARGRHCRIAFHMNGPSYDELGVITVGG